MYERIGDSTVSWRPRSPNGHMARIFGEFRSGLAYGLSLEGVTQWR